MSHSSRLRVDRFSKGIAVGVLAYEARVDDVRSFCRESRDTARRADRCATDVSIILAHALIIPGEARAPSILTRATPGRPSTGSCNPGPVQSDLDLALELADIADQTTMQWWSVAGVASDVKDDGTLVTAADIATEQELLEAVRRARSQDGFLGERDWPWNHANWVASGVADTCVWFGGGPWDLAAPSILVEEAGGRFSDHRGGRRLDTRTAIYSNGARHDDVLAALAPTSLLSESSHRDPPPGSPTARSRWRRKNPSIACIVTGPALSSNVRSPLVARRSGH